MTGEAQPSAQTSGLFGFSPGDSTVFSLKIKIDYVPFHACSIRFKAGSIWQGCVEKFYIQLIYDQRYNSVVAQFMTLHSRRTTEHEFECLQFAGISLMT